MEMKNMQLFADNPTVNVTTDSGLSAENKTFSRPGPDRGGPAQPHPRPVRPRSGPSPETEAS